MSTVPIPQTTPEPPDKATVGLVDPRGEAVTLYFDRDDSVLAEAHEDSWYDGRGDAWTWADIEAEARRSGREIHRLYRREELPMSVVAALDAAEQAVNVDA